MPPRKRGHTTMIRRVTPASDVTSKTKTITNLGTSAAAGVVSGAWCSFEQVDQVLETP